MEKQQAQGQRSVTGPPSLHIQTQGVQPQPPVQASAEGSAGAPLAANPQFPPRKSSMKRETRPDLTVDPVVHPPRTSSRSASPASAAVRSPVSATGSAAPKFVRPSDIYRRMEEEKGRERKSIDAARPSLDGTSDHVDAADATARQPPRPSFGRNDSGGGGGEGARALQPLAPVAERKSEYGFDGLMINPGTGKEPNAASNVEPEPAKQTRATRMREIEPEPEPESQPPPPPTLGAPQITAQEVTVQQPKKRFSTSPKLPDLTRMSGFGSDFFSSAGGFLGGPSKQPESAADSRGAAAPGPTAPTGATRQSGTDAEPAAPKQPKPFRPSIPGNWVSETPTPGEMATPFGLKEQPEDLSLKPAPLRTPTPRSGSRPVDDEDKASLRSGGHGSPGMPQPLRTTPSPSKLSLVERQGETSKGEKEGESSSDAARTSDAKTVAPAPLRPRKNPMPDPAAEDLRHPIMRLNTDSTTGDSSPLKESDFLRDEIIRSLSPVRSSDTLLGPSQEEGAARESAYLNDVYGDYWNPEDAASAAPEKHVAGGEPRAAPREEATPTPPAHEWTSRLPPAGEVEADRPGLKRERFSWEPAPTSPGPVATPSPTKYVHALPPLPTETAESAHPPAPPPAAPEPASPVDSTTTLSPLIGLPVLSFGGEDETGGSKGHTRAVSAVSMLPPGSDTVMEPPSPISPAHDHDETRRVDGEGRLLSASEEKIVLASPTSPNSSGSPPAVLGSERHAADPDHAESPPPTPTDIPLPRSPSSNKDAAAETGTLFPTTVEEKNMMSLHQIMQLPTSPERVYQMLETRAEFAATPSGLGQWLAQMLAQPEHAQGGPFFRYPPAGADVDLLGAWATRKPANNHGGGGDGSGGGGGGGGGGGVETELTSSSVGTTGLSSGGGSVRIAREANLQLGNLMHGTGQAGAKGKELLQSAGKMGKGLLSKGKNKLRERAESKRGM